MDLTRFYVRNRKVIFPTVARAEAGFFVDVKPVRIIDIADLNLVKRTLVEILSQDNPVIPTPSPDQEPGSVVLDALNIKRWEAFEKESVLYTIHRGREVITSYVTGRSKSGMWTREKERERTYALDTSAEEMAQTILEDVLAQPEGRRREPSLPMLLPPPAPESDS